LLLGSLNAADNDLKVSVIAFDPASQTRTTLVEAGGGFGFIPNEPDSTRGYLVYGQHGALFAAPFDSAELWIGDASPVDDGVLEAIPQVLTEVGLSASGTLVYPSASATNGAAADDAAFQSLIAVDRSGASSVLGSALTYNEVTVREGRAAASALELSGSGLAADLWVYQLDNSRAPARLGLPGININAVWSPDAASIFYIHIDDLVAQTVNGGEFRSVAVDRSAAPVTVFAFAPDVAAANGVIAAVSPDGQYLAGTIDREQTGSGDIWLLPLDRDATAGPATSDDFRFPLETPDDEYHPAVSPDGRWIAYSSNATGRHEIHVKSFPEFTGNYVVSTEGGVQPVWNPAGDELFFLNGQRMMVVRYASSNTFDYDDAVVLFEDPVLTLAARNANARLYDYDPGSDRFVVVSQFGTDADNQAVELRIVRNFADELRALVPWPDR
jgi:hypothetical protein